MENPTLLQLIEDEIIRSGGRDRVAFIITNVESREYFTRGVIDTFSYREKIRVAKAHRAAIEPKLPNQWWSQDELDFLINNKNLMTYREIGKVLNRSWSAVKYKGSELNKLLKLNV